MRMAGVKYLHTSSSLVKKKEIVMMCIVRIQAIFVHSGIHIP